MLTRPVALIGLLIIGGEFLTIIAELGAIRLAAAGMHAWLSIFLMTIVYVLSGCCLLPAYSYAEKQCRSTWTTAALTIGTVLILEPITITAFFSETPSNASLLGFACGVIGLVFCIYDSFSATKELL